MTDVFVVSDNIISPVGLTTADNFNALKNGISGIRLHSDESMSAEPFYASLFEPDTFKTNTQHTKFEQMLIASISAALVDLGPTPALNTTGLIISSTKGNISLIETEEPSAELNKRVSLPASAKLVAQHFGFTAQPFVISNACISGIVGILTAKRLIQAGLYETVIVSGADVITKFILSGFQSFNAVSAQPCKPFDIDRDGVTLGEGAATVILSSNPKYAGNIRVTGGATSNDANHISAPSRTGEELAQAIAVSLSEANLVSSDIDFICAHGTATVYNDEMEAKAITLAGLEATPLNSLKGYYGHTLGAAGLIEAIIAMQSLKGNIILPTPGFQYIGVPTPVNVSSKLVYKPLKNCLKTASGFGGCNAAMVFSKPD